MSTAIDGIPELWADLKQFAVPAKNSIYWTSFPARKAARGAMKYILVTPTKHLNDFLWNVGYIYRNLSTFGRVLTWNANRLKYSSRNGATMELVLNISLGTPPKIKSTLIFFESKVWPITQDMKAPHQQFPEKSSLTLPMLEKWTIMTSRINVSASRAHQSNRFSI